MIFRFIVPLLTCSLLFSCSQDEAPSLSFADRLATTTWEFSLENTPATSGDRFFFRPGVTLTTDGDTARLTNGFFQQEMSYPVRGTSGDTLGGTTVGWQETPLGGLMVGRYEKDSLVAKALFYPATNESADLEWAELIGKTYRVYPDTGAPFRVYFGEDNNLRGALGRTGYYYLVGEEYQNEPRSVISASSNRYYAREFYPIPFNSMRYYSGAQHHFMSNENLTVRRLPDGKIEISTVGDKGEAYQVNRGRMKLLPSIIPDSVDLQTFTDLLNYGDLTVDTSYPAPDSAKVKYAYEEDFPRWGGVHLREVPDLEFNYSPLDGSFNTFVRQRKIEGGRWQFSPDRNYLIHLGKEDRHQKLVPIISYDAEGLALRIPLSIQTREPRGVKLLSYCKVDAYVAVKHPELATK